MRNALAAVSLLLVLGVGGAVADAPPATAPAQAPWAAPLAAYVRNPVSGGAALRALGRDHPEGLPPFVVLAIADAEMRAGHRRRATSLYQEVRDGDPGQPWQDWADFGLASIGLLTGDASDAQARLTAIADGGGPNSAAAIMMMSLVAAQSGDFPSAGAGFDRVAASTEASPNLREAARLGAAYARYWEGDLAWAQSSFAAMASANPGSRFADDARYGAAWIRVRKGDPAGVAALRDLAGETPSSRQGGATSRGAVDLEPAAVLRGSERRYRRGSIAPPEEMLAGVLDGDGVALARAALHRLDTGDDAPSAVAREPAAPVGRPSSRLEVAAPREPEARPPTERPPAPAPPAASWGPWRWAAPVLVILLIATFAAWRRSRVRR